MGVLVEVFVVLVVAVGFFVSVVASVAGEVLRLVEVFVVLGVVMGFRVVVG